MNVKTFKGFQLRVRERNYVRIAGQFWREYRGTAEEKSCRLRCTVKPSETRVENGDVLTYRIISILVGQKLINQPERRVIFRPQIGCDLFLQRLKFFSRKTSFFNLFGINKTIQIRGFAQSADELKKWCPYCSAPCINNAAFSLPTCTI